MPRPRYRKSVRLWNRAATSSISRRHLQRLLEQQRQLQQRVDVPLSRPRAKHAAHLTRRSASRYKRDQLRRERLGRGDADLRAGVRVDRPVGLARGHAADDVADGDAAGALTLRLAQRGQRVGRLARLRDDDGERIRRDDRVPVAVLGAVIDLDRDPRELLDHELADQPRVPRRAAGEDRHALDGRRARASEIFISSRNTLPDSCETRPRIVSRAAAAARRSP